MQRLTIRRRSVPVGFSTTCFICNKDMEDLVMYAVMLPDLVCCDICKPILERCEEPDIYTELYYWRKVHKLSENPKYRLVMRLVCESCVEHADIDEVLHFFKEEFFIEEPTIGTGKRILVKEVLV